MVKKCIDPLLKNKFQYFCSVQDEDAQHGDLGNGDRWNRDVAG